MKKTPTPPKWATAFLTAYCRPQLLEDLQGDLNEYFQRNLQSKGAFLAKLIYVLDVLKFFRPYTIRKPRLTIQNRNFMIGTYIKTSSRVIARNKLFSGINIFGMAVSLSVGLLVIAYISDLLSYDSKLQNKDRIYRVVSGFHPDGNPMEMKLASTSWKAGLLIQQQAPGIESMVILRNWFRGDAQIKESKIPVAGIYAGEGFFDVFSFPLLKGVASSALKQPHSLVLTETTAKKLFGNADPMGKLVKFDTVNYTVTGVLKDIPKFSHIHFELLASLSSLDVNAPATSDGAYMDWTNFFSNYVYVLLKKNTDPAAFAAALEKISAKENASLTLDHKVFLSPQPLNKIAYGHSMGNEIGEVINPAEVYILGGLAIVILLSACFNYTNLSIARSLRRSREVGIRKVVGAKRIQVMGQFIVESVLIALISLVIAFFIFLFLRSQFLGFHEDIARRFSLELSSGPVLGFIALAFFVGIVAGLLPALFYSKINAVTVLKDASSLKVFRHLTLRKVLVVIQYTFSLAFIAGTVIGYHQYKGMLRFDLGFKTENVLNIDMQGNKDEAFAKQLAAVPGVKMVSKSLLVTSLGSMTGGWMHYHGDSSKVDMNHVDENYLPLHEYRFLAGRNLLHQTKEAPNSEVIVNQELINRFNIGHRDPNKAIGEILTWNDHKLTIAGVLQDFHYGTLESRINPTGILYLADPGTYVNVKLAPLNQAATLTAIETLWKQLDAVHPLQAKFYDDQIAFAYSQFSVFLKVVGFFAFLAICISSLGLFGMVMYTMEKRVKEISIRRVLGAEQGGLIFLLSKGFLFLLVISAAIALPLTWLFFQRVVLRDVAYHQPVNPADLFIGLFFVGGIAFVMIGWQTLKVVSANPATVLKNE